MTCLSDVSVVSEVSVNVISRLWSLRQLLVVASD